MRYEIRQVRPEEVRDALDLALSVFMKFEAPIYSSDGVKKFIYDCINNKEYADNFITGKHLMLGAFDKDKIIGLISEIGNGHISMVFVDSNYHRQGVATAIMEKMINTFRIDGIKTVTLNSSPYGVPFYHNFGFVDSGKEQHVDGFIITPMKFKINN